MSGVFGSDLGCGYNDHILENDRCSHSLMMVMEMESWLWKTICLHRWLSISTSTLYNLSESQDPDRMRNANQILAIAWASRKHPPERPPASALLDAAINPPERGRPLAPALEAAAGR